MSLGFNINVDDKACVLKISGEIDETSNFQKIEIPETRHLVIDLKDLRQMNSVGLRSWVLWTRALKVPLITLRNCPSIAVHQVNVLEGFLPLQAVLESFEIPYICEHCGHEEKLWAERGKTFMERLGNQPEWIKYEDIIKCSKCGKDAELDVMPLRYFSFLKNRR